MINELEWQVVTDPEELFRLKKAGWEIERSSMGGYDLTPWFGNVWDCTNIYRARQPKPKMKQIKMECFLINSELRWRDEKLSLSSDWIRQPHLDLIAEVPE